MPTQALSNGRLDRLPLQRVAGDTRSTSTVSRRSETASRSRRGGGRHPRWSHDGTELFFISLDAQQMLFSRSANRR